MTILGVYHLYGRKIPSHYLSFQPLSLPNPLLYISLYFPFFPSSPLSSIHVFFSSSLSIYMYIVIYLSLSLFPFLCSLFPFHRFLFLSCFDYLLNFHSLFFSAFSLYPLRPFAFSTIITF